jgi:predicted HTH domain antitoxin
MVSIDILYKRTFMNSLRRATSLTITFSFLIMSYTGFILFIAPKGRVANWTNWELLGLDKTQYGNLHATFMVLFFVGVCFHIYLNWSPLMSYFKNKSREFSLLTKEFVFAFLINLFFVLGVLYYWVGFEQFLDFQDNMKASWEKKADKAPYGHAELSSIEEFAKITGTDANTIVEQLTARNIKGVSLEKTIEEIAKENKKSPSELFEMINVKKKTTVLKEGGGYGRLSLAEACEQQNIDINEALEIIKEKGFNATQESTVREIADALHTSPIQLLEMLQ